MRSLLLPLLALALVFSVVACSGATDDPEPVENTGVDDPTPGTDDGVDDPPTDGVDDPVDGVDDPPVDGPCVLTDEPIERAIVIPLGETLFVDHGDDYLTFLDDGNPDECEPKLAEAPENAAADLVDGRLTPDVAGQWVLTRGDIRVTVTVDPDYLNSDTFLNYNYTPVLPVALLGDDRALVVCPTSNAVQVVTLAEDGATADVLVPTGAWPTSVAIWADGGYALVAQTGRDSLGFLDLETLKLTDAIPVGNEPAGIAIDGDTAYVTLSGENRVVRVDLKARTVTGSVDTGHDPRALVLSADGARLYVASLMSFNEHRFGLLGGDTEPHLLRDVTIVDTADFERLGFIQEIGTMIRGLWLAPDGNRLVAAVTHSNNDGASIDADSQPHSHGLAVLDLVDGESGPTATVAHIDLDYRDGSAGPAASPFTMAQTPDGKHLVVSLSASQALLVLDPNTYEELMRIPTGNDPRGLVFAKGRVWTTSWLDNQLEGIALPLEPTSDTVTVAVGADPTPLAVRQGQRMFNDAKFSKHGDFSCNNCHIDGLTDGLVWDLLVDGSVNTLAFRNVAGTDPFLWGAQLPSLFDFSREVLRLVGANASGEDMEALTLYMQSITAPPNPYTRPGGRLTQEAELGRAVFDAAAGQGGAGCAVCHSGPLFTNRQLVDGKTEGVKTDVPGLIGVYDTPPYGREGQWATLEAMVEYAVEFTGGTLTAEEMAALNAYVRQIPGDALWLNSARPLSGSDHVWVETPIELTFSQLLAPGQEDLFSMAIAEDEPVAGDWTISGRVARFEPTDGTLVHETDYTIEVGAGLEGALGQVLRSPLTIEFATGGVPETDVSGKWLATLQATQVLPGLIDFDPQADIAFLQATGGNMTGVINSQFDVATISHIEGVVSGMTMVLEPFLFDTDFGQIKLESGFAEMVDENGDGWAEYGVGEVSALGYTVPWFMHRVSIPE